MKVSFRTNGNFSYISRVEENSYFPITMECFEREINKIFLIIRKKSKRISV